jgi:tRNA nucleotidyltransferase (CCA-adding enzyme)
MKTYLVGGAVRDALLGLPVTDRDWVVVGATPDDLVRQGFVPVGRDFPVFLHPRTHEEYALARTERKSGPGYRGFTIHAAPDVSLQDDLARRDLTINSIAVDQELIRVDGLFLLQESSLIDPWGGYRDIRLGVLRHVTPAFREDPVRILRVGRLAARFGHFHVAPETMALMREMVASGEADHLVPERVWQELSRGLMAAQPSRMLQVLQACGALEKLLPELQPQPGQLPDRLPELMATLDRAAGRDTALAVRFACLATFCSDAALQALCQRLRVPSECQELAQVVVREQAAIRQAEALDAAGLLGLLERCDAFRKPQRLTLILQACEIVAVNHPVTATGLPQDSSLRWALTRATSVDTGAVARQANADGLSGASVGERIRAARIEALRKTFDGML